MPACAGGEAPHLLLGLGLRKCWMIVAVLLVIFGASFDTSAPLLTPSSCGAAVFLLLVQTSVFPCFARSMAESAALPRAARRDSSMDACLAGLTSRAGAGSSSHRCIPQHVPW